jgi:hypothetical protein
LGACNRFHLAIAVHPDPRIQWHDYLYGNLQTEDAQSPLADVATWELAFQKITFFQSEIFTSAP